MTNIIVNRNKNTIEVSKNFYKSAMIYNSEEYNTLLEIQSNFPNYSIKVKPAKRSNKMNGLTFEIMEQFLNKEENKDNLNDFLTLKNKKVDYLNIYSWFVDKYPQFKECKNYADVVLLAA